MTDLKELIPLTLTPHANSLDGITLYEPVELSLLDKLIHSPPLLKKGREGKIDDKKILTDYRGNYRKLRVEVRYTRNEKISYGRFLPDRALGLHNMRRRIRHTLIGEWGQDVDIANAHPKMLEQITTLHEIQNDWVRDYCDNRETWLERIVAYWQLNLHPDVIAGKEKARDIAKELMLVLSYGGGLQSWKDEWKRTDNEYEIPDKEIPNEIDNFKQNIHDIHKKITEANPHLTQQIIAHKAAHGQPEGTYNINGSVCSYFLQEYECRILETIYQYCLHQKYIKNGEVMLCADGIILNKKLYHDGIPAELEQVIQEKTGFQLRIEPKAMNSGYSSKEIRDALDFDLLSNVFTTGYLANIFRILYSDKFIFTTGELRTYNGVYWRGENDKNYSSLHNWIDDRFYHYLNGIISKEIWQVNVKINDCPDTEEGKKRKKSLKEELEVLQKRQYECEQICRNIKKRAPLVSDIINKISNPDIIWDDDPDQLVFTNKIYDLKQECWITPNYRDYNSLTTGYNWNEYELGQKKNRLLRLIDTIFPDKRIRDYYLTALATGLSGRQQEHLFIATGVGGNGKSLINGLMLTAMGRYGYKMPNWVLQDKIGTGACPELANLNNRRFVLTSEPDRKRKISTNTMKEITGDPTLNARQLYTNTPEGGIQLKLSLFLEANKLPVLDEVGDGVGRRIDVFPFISRFTSENDYKKMLETRSEEEITAAHIYRGNPLYKEDEWKRDNCHALIAILMDYYSVFQKRGYSLGKSPKACEVAKEDYLQASDDLYGWFDNQYQLADENHPETVMKIADIYTDFKHSTYFNKLPSKDQNKNTKKYFTGELNDNINLRMYIRKRDTRYAGQYYKSDYMIGWRRKEQHEEKDEEEDGELEAYAEEK
jgi:phage/plasmid-associated DNA primase